MEKLQRGGDLDLRDRWLLTAVKGWDNQVSGSWDLHLGSVLQNQVQLLQLRVRRIFARSL